MKTLIKCFLTVCLVSLMAVGMSSCGEKKLDVKKIAELIQLDNPTSSQIDEMIDQLEAFVNTSDEELEKLSEEDQMNVAGLMFGMAIMSEGDSVGDDAIKVSDSQKKRIKEIMDKVKDKRVPAN